MTNVGGAVAAAPLVVTVTLNIAAAPLVTCTLAGTWQDAPTGAPEQTKFMVPE